MQNKRIFIYQERNTQVTTYVAIAENILKVFNTFCDNFFDKMIAHVYSEFVQDYIINIVKRNCSLPVHPCFFIIYRT